MKYRKKKKIFKHNLQIAINSLEKSNCEYIVVKFSLDDHLDIVSIVKMIQKITKKTVIAIPKNMVLENISKEYLTNMRNCIDDLLQEEKR